MDESLDDHRGGPLRDTPPGALHTSPVPGLVAIGATAALCAVVVVMGAVASAKGWIPTGDDAFLSLRTRHVISADPILLNNASSAGPSAGSQYNHPGAFPLTLLSPVTLLGGPGSVALATALLNAAWIAAIALVVRRVAGATAQTAAVVGAAVLVWSMGSGFVIDPWNPTFGMWPVAALVVATWAVRCGHHRVLWLAVLAASVAFQTHLSLTVISAALAAWALLAVLVRWRGAAAAERGPILRSLVVATAVGVVANAQMLADQFAGTGNLGKILRGTSFSEATLTVRQLAAVLAAKFGLPPWWGRGSWDGPVLLADLPSLGRSLAGLAVVSVATIAALLVLRGHRPDPADPVDPVDPADRVDPARQLTTLFVTVGVAVGVGSVVATRYPLRIGIPLPYLRWVWPLAAVWTVALLGTFALGIPALTRRIGRRADSWGAPPVAPVLAVAAVAMSLAAFVPTNEAISPNPAWAQDISRSFSAKAVEATRDRGPILMEQSIQEAALWVIPALMDQLDAAGIAIRATDRVLVQQTDDAYRATGRERWRLVVRGGADLDLAPDGGVLIARHDDLSPAERDRFEELVAELTPALGEPGAVRLTAMGSAETDAADLTHLTTGELRPDALLRSVPFRLALQRGAVAVDGVDRVALREAARLGARDGGRSIALYLAPT